MTTFNSSIDIDEDVLIEIVTESNDFDSKVNSIIDNYDLSDSLSDAVGNYDFDYDIQNAIERYNFVDADEAITEDNIARIMISEIQQNEDIQYEIRLASNVEMEFDNHPPDETILKIIHTLHSVCGKIAQQIAIINAMSGVTTWPNDVVTELQSIASTLMQYGIDVTKTEQ
jgi:hypothetical protein